MRVLVDTNILLRSAQPSHPLSSVATRSVAKLIRQNEMVCFCAQNISEFWNVATRPAHLNGLGFSADEVRTEVANIEGLLTLLQDGPGIYQEWKRLVHAHNVVGVKVYDARLVAVAKVHGVSSILTFNGDDFKRYGNISVLHPSSF